jgi:PAS domain S-box-containing protein
MGPAGLIGAHLWRDWVLTGAALVNVIEGGRRKRSPGSSIFLDVRELLNSLPIATLLFDTNGKIAECNQAAEHLSRLTRRELLCPGSPLVFPGGNSDKGTFPALIVGRALRGEAIQRDPQSLRGPDGELREILVSASPIRDSANNPKGALLYLEDVSEMATLQRQLVTSEGNSAGSQITAGLVHDFNNVLNTISQATTVLAAHREQSEHDHSMLTIIEQAVRHGAETVANFRQFLVGRREKQLRISLDVLLEDTLRSAQPKLEQHSNVTVQRDLGECSEVHANPDELRRAFTNLVNNALEAMPHGGILAVGCAQGRSHVTVTVRDTGIGMNADIQRKDILSVFHYQGDRHRTWVGRSPRFHSSAGWRDCLQEFARQGQHLHRKAPSAQVQPEERSMGRLNGR